MCVKASRKATGRAGVTCPLSWLFRLWWRNALIRRGRPQPRSRLNVPANVGLVGGPPFGSGPPDLLHDNVVPEATVSEHSVQPSLQGLGSKDLRSCDAHAASSICFHQGRLFGPKNRQELHRKGPGGMPHQHHPFDLGERDFAGAGTQVVDHPHNAAIRVADPDLAPVVAQRPWGVLSRHKLQLPNSRVADN